MAEGANRSRALLLGFLVGVVLVQLAMFYFDVVGIGISGRGDYKGKSDLRMKRLEEGGSIMRAYTLPIWVGASIALATQTVATLQCPETSESLAFLRDFDESKISHVLLEGTLMTVIGAQSGTRVAGDDTENIRAVAITLERFVGTSVPLDVSSGIPSFMIAGGTDLSPTVCVVIGWRWD